MPETLNAVIQACNARAWEWGVAKYRHTDRTILSKPPKIIYVAVGWVKPTPESKAYTGRCDSGSELTALEKAFTGAIEGTER